MQDFRLAQGTADGEHTQYADLFFLSAGQHPRTGGLIDKIEARHYHVPAVVFEREIKHLMLRIGREGFGDTEKTDFARVAQREQRGNEFGMGIGVFVRRDTVQMKDVYMVSAKPPQTSVHALLELRACRQSLLLPRRDFRGEDDCVSRSACQRLADRHLGPVDFGGIQEIDAQVEGRLHDPDRFGLRFAGRHSQTARPAAAQAHHACRKPRPT